MNVPVGKSTYATWAAVVGAVAAGIVEAVQNGWSWQVIILWSVAAGLLAVNGVGRAYQAAHPPLPLDAVSTVGFVPDIDLDVDDTLGYKG